jgi:hypothetical protein
MQNIMKSINSLYTVDVNEILKIVVLWRIKQVIGKS